MCALVQKARVPGLKLQGVVAGAILRSDMASPQSSLSHVVKFSLNCKIAARAISHFSAHNLTVQCGRSASRTDAA